MIKACPYCSNVDVNKLKEVFGEENVKTGCIGNCRAYDSEANVLQDGELIIKENMDELVEYLQNN
ncbi:MAG: DUF1450 domain-containing protein [Peptostreptococcaceae bacterium]